MQAGPVSTGDWNYSEVKLGARKHHASMFWIHRAMLWRSTERWSAGTHLEVTIHHDAVMLAVPSAACGQIRIGIGGCSMHQRCSIECANQRKQQDGSPATQGA